MKIVFEKIRFKNFLSFGNNWTEINLNSHKSTSIIGKNGSGKSTVVLDTICFNLYGKAYRKINKPQLINSVNNKGLSTECHFRIGTTKYKIVRGLKPNVFEIYINDTLVPQDSKSLDYQTYLEKNILKMSFKSFCQIVIIGSASWTPFMQLTTGQRREIIEDLLDQQIFTKMNSILSNKFSELKEEESLNHRNYEILSEKIKLHQKTISEMSKNYDEELDEIENNILFEKDNIERIKEQTLKENEKLEELRSFQEKYNELNSRVIELDNEQYDLDKEIRSLEKSVKFYEKNDSCPTCKNTLSDSFKNQEIQKLLNEKEKLVDRHDAIEKEKYQLKDDEFFLNRNFEIDSSVDKLKKYKNDYLQSKNSISFLEKKRKSVKEKKDQNQKSSEVNFKEIKDQFLSEKKTKEELESKRELYKKAQVLLKDNGIKAKIISNTIPVINKIVNKYLEMMDLFVLFELDETFNETIKSRFLESYSYNNFSEGEKSRINLALLFAWREIARMRNSTATNLLVLDEIFDGPLDTEGSDIFTNLIKDLDKDTNVFVISHNENIQDKFTNTIKVYKKKNFSYIE